MHSCFVSSYFKVLGTGCVLSFCGILVQKLNFMQARAVRIVPAITKKIQRCSCLVATLKLSSNFNSDREDLSLNDLHFNICKKKSLFSSFTWISVSYLYWLNIVLSDDGASEY